MEFINHRMLAEHRHKPKGKKNWIFSNYKWYNGGKRIIRRVAMQIESSIRKSRVGRGRPRDIIFD